MSDQSQYLAAANVPLIKSPSLRVPRPVELPPDIHPLPDSVTPYFAYPFTLEPHILTVESSRRSTIAAHNARHESYLRQREEEKLRRKRDALRRIAPGFEPTEGPLVPLKISKNTEASASDESNTNGSVKVLGHERQKSVMEDLVDHLAKLDSSSST